MLVDELPGRIVLYPDPRLRRKCAPFEGIDDSVGRLAERMLELMHAANGVGLAGPQVGICRRIFVCNPTGESGDDRIFINPVLTDLTGAIEAEEGCLSIPDVRILIRRARRCRISGLDATGRPVEAACEDLLSRIVQHEADHLDGRLIIDRMSGPERIANKKTLAQLEADYKKAK